VRRVVSLISEKVAFEYIGSATKSVGNVAV